ncbi:arylsulfatase [soil metagenome]
MSSNPSNVLIVYTDQWRWDALGCLGSPALTPAIDGLAARGVLFDHAFVQSPVCMPSRVSMLTGQYPSSLGITQMGVPVPEATETIASVVRRRGWHTANIGKLHFQPHANRDHTLPHPSYGFDDLVLSEEPGVYDDDYLAWVRAINPGAAEKVGAGLPPAAVTWRSALGIAAPAKGTDEARDDYAGVRVFDAPAELTHSAWVATRTIDHLNSLGANEPSLTIASFFSPHSPYHVPQQYLDLYDRDSLPLPALTDADRAQQVDQGITDDHLRTIRHGYYAAISEVDHHVGRILETLESLGRADNTIVVFVADHGEWLGDHLRFAKGFPADDPISRVPLIFCWPRGINDPGRTVSSIVEAVDIAPTILDLIGIPIPTPMQGQSLRENLTTIEVPARQLEVGITEHQGWRSMRTATHRYIIRADGTEHLWHVADDPTNATEVTDDRDALLATHRKLLLRHTLAIERTHPRTWAY